jgi:cytoskeletal protein RodZ
MFGLLLPNFKSHLTFIQYPQFMEEKTMTSRKKNFQTSPAKKGLSTLQKTLTFIGSILGIITASLTIYSFSSRAQTNSEETSTSTTVYILSSTEESNQATSQESQETSTTTTEATTTSSQETASSSSSQENATTTEPASETVSGASQTSD